ncbi:MAG: amidase [Acidimicrobiia bacterium]
MGETDDLAFAPALEQARMVRDGEVSPVELVELYLERIDRLNPALGAYLTVASEFARDAAVRAEQTRRGDGTDAPFHGVPISVKDLNDTAGIRTTAGTAGWADRVPEHDDEVVARIRRAGFVILGKTNTPEFGPLNVSETLAYPPGRNPWDPSRSCGGSSGGAAAALAAGLCPVSQGSDGGGSIRNPSAWCGTFGIKPTRGRVSDAPRSMQHFGINGPLGRTVADAAALLDVMAGYAPGDTYFAPPPVRPFAEEAAREPGRLRVAWHPHPGVDASAIAPAHRQACETAAALLEELGHDVEAADPPAFDPDLLARMSLIFAAHHAARADRYPPLDTIAPWNRTMIEMGRTVTATTYITAMRDVEAAARRVVAFFDDVDLLLTPTVAQPPPPVGTLALADDFLTKVPELFALTPFTAMWNVTGQPAVSIPFGFDGDGLPVGVQLVGRPAGEATLVRASAQIEAARPWIGHRPPMAERSTP